MKLRLEEPQTQTCQHCQKPFENEWRGKLYCDPCVPIVRGERSRKAIQEYGYHVPALHAGHELIPDVVQASMDTSLLVLAGPTGTGKTCQLHHLLAKRGVYASRVHFQRAGTLGTDMLDHRQRLLEVSYLGIDDVGRRMTPAVVEALCVLLDHRMDHYLPTWVTTNLTQSEMLAVDDRLGSRMSAGRWLALTGEDFRQGTR